MVEEAILCLNHWHIFLTFKLKYQEFPEGYAKMPIVPHSGGLNCLGDSFQSRFTYTGGVADIQTE